MLRDRSRALGNKCLSWAAARPYSSISHSIMRMPLFDRSPALDIALLFPTKSHPTLSPRLLPLASRSPLALAITCPLNRFVCKLANPLSLRSSFVMASPGFVFVVIHRIILPSGLRCMHQRSLPHFFYAYDNASTLQQQPPNACGSLA